MKKIAMIVLLLALMPLAFYGWMWKNHNQQLAGPTAEQQAQGLERAVSWLVNHREQVLDDNNPMLWWMIKRSAELSGDPRLTSIYQQYYRRYVSGNYQSVWRSLFLPDDAAAVDSSLVSHLPDYNQYFIYGLTCSDELAELPLVKAQLSTDFCGDEHPISPACVTHQMMGLRFRQQRGCGDSEQIAADVATLQETIVDQLTWDVRRVDVYLQRLLMLAESGARSKIEPVWLQHMLSAQLQDGGWGDFHPLLAVSGGRSLGLGSRFFAVRAPQSNLHATAQGIFLLTLLSH